MSLLTWNNEDMGYFPEKRRASPSEAVSDLQSYIAEFQQKFGFAKKEEPGFAYIDLRKSLIIEETKELTDAIDAKDLVKAADALCDIIYVVMGAAETWGIDLGPLLEEVHKTNMAKGGGGHRIDGKVMKPKNWQPPKIKELLEKQGWHEPSPQI